MTSEYMSIAIDLLLLASPFIFTYAVIMTGDHLIQFIMKAVFAFRSRSRY